MSNAVPLAIPWMNKILIDDVLPGKKGFRSLQKVVLVMAGLFSFIIIINFIRNYITDRLGNQMALDLNQQFYEHLQKIITTILRQSPDRNNCLTCAKRCELGTVFDKIASAKPDATHEKVVSAVFAY